MKKKLLSLLLAGIMVFASSMAVVAAPGADVTTGAPPTASYAIKAVHHWVTRGETLDSIAALYGTTVSSIVTNNWVYFADLANRNITMGTNIQVEPGVRLFIHYLLEARVYVYRGTTLAMLASGQYTNTSAPPGVPGGNIISLTLGGGFGMTLAVPAEVIVAQNPSWFDQLAQINITGGGNLALVESPAMVHYVYRPFLPGVAGLPNPGVPGPTNLVGDYVLNPSGNLPFGAPLVISVPVTWASGTGTSVADYVPVYVVPPIDGQWWGTTTVESAPGVFDPFTGVPWWQITTNHFPPTNPGLASQPTGVFTTWFPGMSSNSNLQLVSADLLATYFASWGVGSAPAAAAPAAEAEAPAASAQQTHTVVRTDNLSSIAQRFGTTWQAIWNANRAAIGENPNFLRIGTVLVIPS